MLATLLIIRQFLQNVKEVLQPYLYERHKLGELSMRAVWDLLFSVLLKYARLAAGKVQALPTDPTMPGPGLRGTRPGVGNTERRSAPSKLAFRSGGSKPFVIRVKIVKSKGLEGQKNFHIF